jgi:hypothetical protein
VDGHVSRPGEWGPLINGGAWLTVDGIVEQRLADARAAPLRPR